MESHKKILGILFVVLATFQALLMFVLTTFLTSILTLAISHTDPDQAKIVELVMGIIQYVPALIIVFLSVPALIAGIGLLLQKKWAMILALIMGCLNIFSFPVGTALGIYTIWVYSENSKLDKAAPPQG